MRGGRATLSMPKIGAFAVSISSVRSFATRCSSICAVFDYECQGYKYGTYTIFCGSDYQIKKPDQPPVDKRGEGVGHPRERRPRTQGPGAPSQKE